MTPEEKERHDIGRMLSALNHQLNAAERRIADAEMIELAGVPDLHFGTPFLALVLGVDATQIPTTVRVDCSRCSKVHYVDIKYVTLIVRFKKEKRG